MTIESSGKDKHKITNMRDLAVAIGVSRPTLSRYFQDPSRVRGDTSEKIRRGLERVDYVPNFFATRLNRKTTGLIGVIIPHLNDLFFTSLLDTIELAAMEAGFTIITQSSHGDPELEARGMEKLAWMNADGAIIAPLGQESDASAMVRLSGSLPFVFVDSRLPDVLPETDFVGTDNHQSIGVITEYLCRTGEPPMLFEMPRLNSNSVERKAAYIETMERLGHAPVVLESEGAAERWDFESYAYRVMDEHFGEGRFLQTTILAANDRLAIGAIRAANMHGLFDRRKRNRGLRIAGHDDHPLSRFMTPALTTVSQDVEAIARQAVRLIGECVQRDASHIEPSKIELEATLRIRESA